MGLGLHEPVVFVTVVAILILLFLALRWFWCWYFKINEIVELLTKIEAKLPPHYPNPAKAAKDTFQREFDTGNHNPLSHDEIMAKYGIVNDGERYIYQGRRFRDVRDAATFAESGGG